MKLFVLPNWFTLANLLSGSLACILVILNRSIDWVMYLLIFSLVADLLDGMIARLTHTQSELGVQLDSLADMVTFGLLPGLMMMQLLDFHMAIQNSSSETFSYSFVALSCLGLFITLFSALRLAKFNIDKEQTYYFKGLPTPANTLLIFSLYWLASYEKVDWAKYPLFLLLVIGISCFLLVSNIPLFALKFKKWSWKGNEIKFVFLFISLVLIIVLHVKAIMIILLLYVFTSVVFKKKIKEGTL